MKAQTRILLLVLLLLSAANLLAADALQSGWQDPPREARLRAYWWWLNGCVTRPAITRDLEEMKAKGFGGALLCDADGSSQDGNLRAPHGPTFFSPEWRELYKHALREADRLGLEMSLNIQSGWNLGGPMVTADDAAKKLVWSELRVTGPALLERTLPQPDSRDGYYRDAFVVAYQLQPGEETAQRGSAAARRPLRNWEQKAGHKPLHFSAPDTTPLLEEEEAQPGEEDVRTADVLDLTARLDKDGTLRWEVPGGAWQVLRFGYTIGNRSYVSTSSEGWQGFALDVLDAGAFRRYWDAVVEPLIADAGPLAGSALKYLHTDSWEVEPLNWTPSMREAFQQRRGYDLLPWLPALAGRIVENRNASNRFLHDFRKTLGDLAIDNHYGPFRELAHKHRLLIHPESGGPHAVPVDAQRCLGFNDVPMSEFWAWSWRHRIGDQNRFFVKQPASAAHTYGRRLVAAEGFTTIGPHWQETLWDNLKPAFDKACCEGFNLLVWHAFVCSPAEQGLPGIQYFAGTHLNPNVTWWGKSASFFSYINRCQFMLQQGRFVADVCYYYGDHVPNFAQHKRTDPAHVLPGYDYDVITEEALLKRASVRGDRIVLPDGMSYQVLVLRDHKAISLPVLRKVRQLVNAGATVVGTKPLAAMSLRDSDTTVQQIATALWGSGQVVSQPTAREVLLRAGVKPDFEYVVAEPREGNGPKQRASSPSPLAPDSQARDSSDEAATGIDYIHRRDGDTDIYFVANRANRAERVHCTFRVEGKAPELWDAVSGQRRFAAAYTQAEGRTTLPLDFPPCGSWFVVFRQPAAPHPATAQTNAETGRVLSQLAGPWTVTFDPEWGGPGAVEFPELVTWPSRTEPGIKYYSGTAVYRTTFPWAGDAAVSPGGLYLDLGNVRELAEVKVNGQSCGTTWSPPFRVDISQAVKPGTNQLEVEVVNFWPNRIIGDDSLPPEQRLTRTNIRKLTKDTQLMDSGLLGPVTLQAAK